MVRPAGIEPATFGFEVLPGFQATNQSYPDLDTSAAALRGRTTLREMTPRRGSLVTATVTAHRGLLQGQFEGETHPARTVLDGRVVARTGRDRTCRIQVRDFIAR